MDTNRQADTSSDDGSPRGGGSDLSDTGAGPAMPGAQRGTGGSDVADTGATTGSAGMTGMADDAHGNQAGSDVSDTGSTGMGGTPPEAGS
jgi:hypothetical protein